MELPRSCHAGQKGGREPRVGAFKKRHGPKGLGHRTGWRKPGRGGGRRQGGCRPNLKGRDANQGRWGRGPKGGGESIV